MTAHLMELPDMLQEDIIFEAGRKAWANVRLLSKKRYGSPQRFKLKPNIDRNATLATLMWSPTRPSPLYELIHPCSVYEALATHSTVKWTNNGSQT